MEPVAVAAVLGPAQITYPNGDRTAYVTTAFACRSDVPPAFDGDEIDALRWVGAGEADSMPIAAWLRPWIDDLTIWRLGDPVIFA